MCADHSMKSSAIPDAAMLKTVVRIRSNHNAVERTGSRLKIWLAEARADHGCLAYELNRCPQDESTWWLIGTWRQPSELEAHLQADHLQVFDELLRSGWVREMQFGTEIAVENRLQTLASNAA